MVASIETLKNVITVPLFFLQDNANDNQYQFIKRNANVHDNLKYKMAHVQSNG